ncbi:MAG: putative toxin-antitoxin system toxin component, PIN family [Sulfuritalea sp.]|nr:putative toxin-antitoxin system toxin component, PIN family [Sulfuritalea sp.]
MRVVLDTNTLVSALLSPHGPPRRLLDNARAQVFELCSSPVLVAELLDVVSREKFAQRLAAAGLTPLGIVGEIRRLATMATPTDVPRVVANDADDDHVLACALTAQADLIVSGDKHLLKLGGQYQGIAIVTPAQAVPLVGG